MKEYIQPIIEAIPMRDVAERYGIDVNMHGFAHCPFHSGDRNASLKVYKDGYHCFGCGAHGNSINFVMRLFDTAFYDAMMKMNDDFSLNLPIGRKTSLREQQIYAARYREFLAKRKAEKEEEQRRKEYQESLWDEWCFCDRAKREASPESLAYEIACKRIDYIAYLIDSLPIGGDSYCHQNMQNTT